LTIVYDFSYLVQFDNRHLSSHNCSHKSLMPLADPHDAVPHTHRVVHRCWQCDKLVTDNCHQFTTLIVHLSWQHLRQSATPEIWLVPTKI